MGKRINIGSNFLSITKPKDKPWLTNVYWGLRDGTNRHAHLCLSGAVVIGEPVIAEAWYLRDLNRGDIIKNGSESH